jgi:hypothetical protein
MPAQGYGIPAQSYVMPAQTYAAPTGYAMPSQSYAMPAQTYAAPTYAVPQTYAVPVEQPVERQVFQEQVAVPQQYTTYQNQTTTVMVPQVTCSTITHTRSGHLCSSCRLHSGNL